MLSEDQIYTLAVEEHDNEIWLCVDDGKSVTKIAVFLSEDASKAFTKAFNTNFTKGYTMGKMGI